MSKPIYGGLAVVVFVGLGVMGTAPTLSKTERSLHEAAISEANGIFGPKRTIGSESI